MNNSIAGANDAVNNRSNSIGVAMGIVFFCFESQMKVLMHSAICCEHVSCQTVHGQPQDWKGCASRLVPE